MSREGLSGSVIAAFEHSYKELVSLIKFVLIDFIVDGLAKWIFW